MNVAILFFGQLRWFDSTYKSFQENFLPALANHNVQYFGHFQGGDLNHLDEFKEKYPSSIIEVEPQQPVNEIHDFFGMKHKMHMSLLGQTYSFHKSFSLLKKFKEINDVDFDLYIKLRSDLIFLDKVDLTTFDSDSIYTKDITHWRPLSNYVHDYILFTKKYENVQILADLGFGIDKIIDESTSLLYTGGSNNDMYCCEEILAKHLSNKNVSIKTYSFNVDLARWHKQ